MAARRIKPESPPPPEGCEPVGVEDVARRLGVKRDTVVQWRQRGVIPDPPWTVSGRPCWNWPDVERWAKATGRA